MQPLRPRLIPSTVMLAWLLTSCTTTSPASFVQAGSTDRFTPCPAAPHCVTSQVPAASSHYIAPLRYAGDADLARAALLATLRSASSATVDDAAGPLVHATFHSRILGFVDDVTFLIQPRNDVIDVKSSSRLGFYDLGVNRRRVEHLRAGFETRMKGGQQDDDK